MDLPHLSEQADRYQCSGCHVTVVCDPDPEHHDGELALQVAARSCTACWRRLNPRTGKRFP